MTKKMNIFVAVLAVILFLRNSFFPHFMFKMVYPKYPFRMNSNFIRCSSSYVSGKGKKPLHRMLFFNLLRGFVSEVLKQLVHKGKIDIWELTFVNCCIITYTIYFYFLPLRIFRKLRYVWAWLLMEYYTKHARDFVGKWNLLDD